MLGANRGRGVGKDSPHIVLPLQRWGTSVRLPISQSFGVYSKALSEFLLVFPKL